MYEKRAFNRAEQDLSWKLRMEMEQLEKRIEEIGPCRERSLALTKLDEALLWANAAIAAGGVVPQGSNTAKMVTLNIPIDLYKNDWKKGRD